MTETSTSGLMFLFLKVHSNNPPPKCKIQVSKIMLLLNQAQHILYVYVASPFYILGSATLC